MISRLEELGLSTNEAKVYLALLGIGSASVQHIYENVRIHRPNIYDSLKRLTDKGLVSFIFKEKKRFYKAESPEKFQQILEDKQAKLNSILPSLKEQHQISGEKTSAKIFPGIRGIKAITDDILLSERREVLTFGIPRDVNLKMHSFLQLYHARRIKKKINQKHIYNENAKNRIAHLNSLEFTEAVFLPEEYNSPVTTTIYADKVAFFVWENPTQAILIKNSEMAESYRKYFKLLWSIGFGGVSK